MEEKKALLENKKKEEAKQQKKDDEATSSTCKGLVWGGVAIGLLIIVLIICMIKLESDEKSKKARLTGPGDHIIDDE